MTRRHWVFIAGCVLLVLGIVLNDLVVSWCGGGAMLLCGLALAFDPPKRGRS